MGASRFHDRIELLRLLRQALFEFAEGGQQVVVDLHEGRDVDRGRDHVVRGLAHVHVVVRMNGPFLAERVTEDLVRSIRNHLVRIHVVDVPLPVWKTSRGKWASSLPSMTSWQAWTIAFPIF